MSKTSRSNKDNDATPQGRGHIDVIWADTFGGVYRANNIVDVPPYLSPMATEKFWRDLQRAVADAINAALDAVEDGRAHE